MTGYPLTFVTLSGVAVMISAMTTQIKKQERERLESEREAMRANLLRAMSHDLRTPMNGILGFSDLAKSESDPEKLREYLTKVDFSCHQLVSLLDDLFAMSLIDSGELRIRLAPADLQIV